MFKKENYNYVIANDGYAKNTEKPINFDIFIERNGSFISVENNLETLLCNIDNYSSTFDSIDTNFYAIPSNTQFYLLKVINNEEEMESEVSISSNLPIKHNSHTLSKMLEEVYGEFDFAIKEEALLNISQADTTFNNIVTNSDLLFEKAKKCDKDFFIEVADYFKKEIENNKNEEQSEKKPVFQTLEEVKELLQSDKNILFQKELTIQQDFFSSSKYYYENKKGYQARLIYLSSDEYKQAVKLRQPNHTVNFNKIKNLENLTKQGIKFEIPYLKYGMLNIDEEADRFHFGQEGFHRSLLAKNMNIKEIPVLVAFRNDDETIPSFIKEKLNKKTKEQSRDEMLEAINDLSKEELLTIVNQFIDNKLIDNSHLDKIVKDFEDKNSPKKEDDVVDSNESKKIRRDR